MIVHKDGFDARDLAEKAANILTKNSGPEVINHIPDEYYLVWYSWPQLWSDTSCGFGGLAGQAFTTAQTHVFMSAYTGSVVVFHAGRFAYYIDKPNAQFESDRANKQLLGLARYAGQYEFKPTST